MKLFDIAYRAPRIDAETVYKGFGFRHRSDISRHCAGSSRSGDSRPAPLCQAVAEGILFLAWTLPSRSHAGGADPAGNYWASPGGQDVYLEADVPEDWRTNGVVESRVRSYRARLEGRELALAAFDVFGNAIPGKAEEVNLLYKLLPAFAVLTARQMERNPATLAAFEGFRASPTPDVLARLHEELFLRCGDEEFHVTYGAVPAIDKDATESYAGRVAASFADHLERAAGAVAAIDRFDPGAFPGANRALVPELPGEFELPARLRSLCNAIRHGDVLSTLFHGPAGTGKTMACKLVCRETGLPLMETINCTENLDEFVLGKYLPEGRDIVFRETQVAKAVREGGAVVFEEINFAKPQYLAFLNSLLDDNGFVRLDNGEVVRRHPLFRFFATMNPGYFGTKELNQALYNRFNAVVELSDLGDGAIGRMLLARVPGCRPALGKMLGVYRKLRKTVGSDDPDAVISPRNLENWARLAKYEGYVAAAEKALVSVARCDRQLEQVVRDVVMLYRWD